MRALNEAMITVSSNFATNILIDKIGADNVRATVRRLGGDGMVVLRGVEDQKAFDKGMNNATTARALMVLFEKLGRGEAVSATADAQMIAVLKRQKFNDAIPGGVPAGTAVAHKTGSITRIHHDAGIVYGPRPYVLVVLVRGIQDQKVSTALIANISRAVWEHVRTNAGHEAQKTYMKFTTGKATKSPTPIGKPSARSADSRSPRNRTPPDKIPSPPCHM